MSHTDNCGVVTYICYNGIERENMANEVETTEAQATLDKLVALLRNDVVALDIMVNGAKTCIVDAETNSLSQQFHCGRALAYGVCRDDLRGILRRCGL